MSMTQKASVYAATMAVLDEAGVQLNGRNVKEIITKEQRSEVVDMVTASILAKETVLSIEAQEKHNTPEKVRCYVYSMVTNWFTKDTRLNGGEKHVPKNPGSRSSDPQLSALKKLRLVNEGNADALVAIDEAITIRQSEIAAAKVKKIEIDVNALPEHLRDLI